jgi:hypothetical protein
MRLARSKSVAVASDLADALARNRECEPAVAEILIERPAWRTQLATLDKVWSGIARCADGEAAMILYDHPLSSYAQKLKIALREKGRFVLCRIPAHVSLTASALNPPSNRFLPGRSLISGLSFEA